MKITIPKALYTQIAKVKTMQKTLKEQVVKPAANEALETVKFVIETDESANAHGRTNAHTSWDPISGRRTVYDTMYESAEIWDNEQNGESIGWKIAEDYIVGQDEGWGSQGSAPEPEGALYSSVSGARFLDAGEQAAEGVIDKELDNLTKGLS
jgi:hypothetical protein